MKSVVICGTPRSGTSFISGLLASTGRVNLPREWFNPEEEPEGITDYCAFVDGVVAGCSRDVFGVKFVGDQLRSFLARLRSSARADDLSDRALLEEVFPHPHFVWLTRDDTVAQAVSLWRAGKTDEWWVPAGTRAESPAVPPPYDFHEIDSRVDEIVRGNELWERWFEVNEIAPHRLVYEALDASPVELARHVLAFLGIVVPEDVTIVAQSSRQSDALNREWIARYRSTASSLKSVEGDCPAA